MKTKKVGRPKKDQKAIRKNVSFVDDSLPTLKSIAERESIKTGPVYWVSRAVAFLIDYYQKKEFLGKYNSFKK